MKKYFKILKIAASELIYQSGNFPIQGMIPFGPPFDSKKGAKDWLKIHAEEGMQFSFFRFYSTEIPEGMVLTEKKPKEKKQKPEQ